MGNRRDRERQGQTDRDKNSPVQGESEKGRDGMAGQVENSVGQDQATEFAFLDERFVQIEDALIKAAGTFAINPNHSREHREMREALNSLSCIWGRYIDLVAPHEDARLVGSSGNKPNLVAKKEEAPPKQDTKCICSWKPINMECPRHGYPLATPAGYVGNTSKTVAKKESAPPEGEARATSDGSGANS